MYNIFEGGERVRDGFDSRIFLMESEGAGFLNFDRSRFKLLAPKQILQRLPIALSQIKAGNNSETLLNEIRKIIYSLHQSKEIDKKVHNNII